MLSKLGATQDLVSLDHHQCLRVKRASATPQAGYVPSVHEVHQKNTKIKIKR